MSKVVEFTYKVTFNLEEGQDPLDEAVMDSLTEKSRKIVGEEDPEILIKDAD
jgi:hypothetical protein